MKWTETKTKSKKIFSEVATERKERQQKEGDLKRHLESKNKMKNVIKMITCNKTCKYFKTNCIRKSVI